MELFSRSSNVDVPTVSSLSLPGSSSTSSTLSPAQGDVTEDYMEVDGDGVGFSDTVFLML